jgi:hypothetical protein
MLNSEPIDTDAEASKVSALSRAVGALALAGLATFIVVAIWFAFYLLVFVPRAGSP